MPQTIELDAKPRRASILPRHEQPKSIELKVDSSDPKSLYLMARKQSSVAAIQPNIQRKVRCDIESAMKAIESANPILNHCFSYTKVDWVEQHIDVVGVSVGKRQVLVTYPTDQPENAVVSAKPISQCQLDKLRDLIARQVRETVAKFWEEPRGRTLVREAQEFEAAFGVDRALDLIYSECDHLMREGQFESLNDIIDSLDPDGLSLDLILGFLTASLPAKSNLPSRASFLESSIRAIRERGVYEDDLLSGL
jgi:hypothetical protein